MPMPRSLPRALALRRRFGNDDHSAAAMQRSITCLELAGIEQ